MAGTPDIESFLDGGRLAAETVRDLLAMAGRPIEECPAILDFGCGCGRVLRNWNQVPGIAVYGTDRDAGLIDWCRRNLPFARVSINPDQPPTGFETGSMDAIYVFSVLTHLPADAQREWLREFHRILKPGGLLVFSTHGSYYLSQLSEREAQRFSAGELVVRFALAAGSNLCNAYHPEAYVRRELAPGWEPLAFFPQGARGNPRQDAWVFRRL